MSVVWLGHDEVLRRDVAIKLLASDVTADPRVRDTVRLEALEALAAARVSHPNIVGVYDYGESADGSSYVVMELVHGHTLASMLTEGPLPCPEAVRICASIGAALAAAHREGIAHRDVTPGNVMVSGSGVKLVDFGISALGLVLYRTLVGRLTWDAATVTQMLQAHYYVEPGLLPPIDGLPPEVARVCGQCLARRRSPRSSRGVAPGSARPWLS